MTVTTIEDGDTVRVAMAGELDALSVAELVPVLDELLQRAPRHWVFDLSDLGLIDGSGVGAIIHAFRRLRVRGAAMTIEGATAQPLSILRLMRLDRVFEQRTA
jgi:stage II sporulation protein AA (anti-sigma F factor antagonist)